MALLTTWGKKNRVINEELTTTYKRTKKEYPQGEASQRIFYWEYERTRTKKYEYIGLTHGAAIACANAMNILYSRRTLEQRLWMNGGNVPIPGSSEWWFYASDRFNPGGLSRDPVNAYEDYLATDVKCGVAVPEYVSGDAWKVIVDVNEILTYKYYVLGGDHPPEPWAAFENNPNATYYEFTGARDNQLSTLVNRNVNENYDTGDVGYGSPS